MICIHMMDGISPFKGILTSVSMSMRTYVVVPHFST